MIKMDVRTPTDEEKAVFKQVDARIDNLMQQRKSNIEMRKKMFMKISDVDVEDAEWFKAYCDKYYDGKQFLGIKMIREVMTRMDPLVTNILTQLTQLTERVSKLEEVPEVPLIQEEEPKIPLPKTQGKKVEK